MYGLLSHLLFALWRALLQPPQTERSSNNLKPAALPPNNLKLSVAQNGASSSDVVASHASFSASDCKGTTFFANTQIQPRKNAFFIISVRLKYCFLVDNSGSTIKNN